MQPVDSAFAAFKALRPNIEMHSGSLVTESDTRLKVIDQVLTDVLGWPRNEIMTESKTIDGFADYALQVGDLTQAVFEAKRDGRTLGIAGREAGQSFKLNGPVFGSEAAREGIRQAIAYCGSKNAELACVTNGREWIVFRGSRAGDGRETMQGMGFVFPGWDGVETRFALFYDLLARDNVRGKKFKSFFQEAEGQPIRTTIFRKSVRRAGSAHLVKRARLATELDRVMSAYFDRLTIDDDPDLLASCFVETEESRDADFRMARISEQILSQIEDLDTSDSDALTQLIERATQTHRHEFIVLVGTKGAGKSTFIHRFFTQVMNEDLAKKCVVIKVDLLDATPDTSTIVQWLDATLLGAAERDLSNGDPPDFNLLKGMFYDEYTRLKKGNWSVLYQSDYRQFEINFGERMEKFRDERPHEYIRGLIRHVVQGSKRLPVIVFDNADHFEIEFQEKVYQYARSIYEKEVCLVILPITDRTSWQLSRQGALQSFEHEALFLPTPSTAQVLRRRVEFLGRRVDLHRERATAFFVRGAISLTVADLVAFAESLQKVFIESPKAAAWIGDLSNRSVRRSLQLTRDLVSSPHLKVEDLVTAAISGTAMFVQPSKIANAIIRGKYDIYNVGNHSYIQNVFALNDELDTSPLLGISILQLLVDKRGQDPDATFLMADQLTGYFEACGIEARACVLWAEALLRAGLCQNYDPTRLDFDPSSRVEITPSGAQHLYWAKANWEYLAAMAEVTPILDEEVFESLKALTAEHGKQNQRRLRSMQFVDYLLQEDRHFVGLSDHPSQGGQHEVRRTLKRTRDLLDPSPQGADLDRASSEFGDPPIAPS